mgnify:CR=1 FL=1
MSRECANSLYFLNKKINTKIYPFRDSKIQKIPSQKILPKFFCKYSTYLSEHFRRLKGDGFLTKNIFFDLKTFFQEKILKQSKNTCNQLEYIIMISTKIQNKILKILKVSLKLKYYQTPEISHGEQQDS